MKNHTYSEEIAQAINNHLTENDFHYQFDEERGVFHYNVGIPGKVKTLKYLVVVKDHDFTVYAIFPLSPDPDDEKEMIAMAKFLHRANYGLRVGNFELDMNDGEIRYKVNCICRDITPSDGMIFEAIHCPAMMCERYSSGILDVLFRGVPEKEALSNCEASSHSSSILSRLEALRKKLVENGDEKGDDEKDDEPAPAVSISEEARPKSFADFLRMLKAEASSRDEDGQEVDKAFADADTSPDSEDLK